MLKDFVKPLFSKDEIFHYWATMLKFPHGTAVAAGQVPPHIFILVEYMSLAMLMYVHRPQHEHMCSLLKLEATVWNLKSIHFPTTFLLSSPL